MITAVKYRDIRHLHNSIFENVESGSKLLRNSSFYSFMEKDASSLTHKYIQIQ